MVSDFTAIEWFTTLQLDNVKNVMQGNLFQRCTHLLHCSVLSLGEAWHGIHLSHKKSMKYSGNSILSWIIKIFKTLCFYPPRIINEHWCTYFCLQIPPRENWFQYVRRGYATAINFPFIITLWDRKCFPLVILKYCTV